MNERFLRNVEAFLLCARRHNVAVNFTFFAFAPQINGHEESEAGPIRISTLAPFMPSSNTCFLW